MSVPNQCSEILKSVNIFILKTKTLALCNTLVMFSRTGLNYSQYEILCRCSECEKSGKYMYMQLI